MLPFPSPTTPQDDRRQVLLGYLDYFRSVIRDRLTGPEDTWLRASDLPSGWAPLELLKHLVFMERRWFVWGFAGEYVADAWGEQRDERWHVTGDDTLDGLLDLLHRGGERTRAIVESHQLSDLGAPSERWDGAPPPTLERVLLHVLQEYARHAGHLDIVRERVDGRVGE